MYVIHCTPYDVNVHVCVCVCVRACTKLYLRSDTLLNMLPGEQPVYTKELNLSLHKPKLDCISSSFATGSWAD